jgi:hypothetical protein
VRSLFSFCLKSRRLKSIQSAAVTLIKRAFLARWISNIDGFLHVDSLLAIHPVRPGDVDKFISHVIWRGACSIIERYRAVNVLLIAPALNDSFRLKSGAPTWTFIRIWSIHSRLPIWRPNKWPIYSLLLLRRRTYIMDPFAQYARLYTHTGRECNAYCASWGSPKSYSKDVLYVARWRWIHLSLPLLIDIYKYLVKMTRRRKSSTRSDCRRPLLKIPLFPQ